VSSSSDSNTASASATHSQSQSQKLVNFDLKLKNRGVKTVWLLTNNSNPQDKQVQAESGLAARLKEEIFSNTGPGWKGMDSGVVCEEEGEEGKKDESGEEVLDGVEGGASDEAGGKVAEEDRGVRALLRTVDRVVREFVAEMSANKGKQGQESETQVATAEQSGGGSGSGANNEDVIMID